MAAGKGSRWRRQVEPPEEEVEQRSYGSKLAYQCGLARRFQDDETQCRGRMMGSGV